MPRPRSIPQTTVKEIRAVIQLGEDQVMARLLKFISSIKNTRAIQTFRRQEANLLDRVRAQALMALDEALLDPVRRAKIYPQGLAWIYAVLYDKMRLERDKSTTNVSVLSAVIEQVHRKPKTPGRDPNDDAPVSTGKASRRDPATLVEAEAQPSE